jgi:hypothetical protein
MLHSVVFRVFEKGTKAFSHVYTQPFQGLITIINEISNTSNKDSKWIIELTKNDRVIDKWTITSSHNYRAGVSVITISYKFKDVVLTLNNNPYKVIDEAAKLMNQDPDGFGYNLQFNSLSEEVLWKLDNLHFLEFRNDYFPHNLYYNIKKMFNEVNDRLRLEAKFKEIGAIVTSDIIGNRIKRTIKFKNGKIIKF